MAAIDDTQGGGGTGSPILNTNVVIASSGYEAEAAAQNLEWTNQQKLADAQASHDAIGEAATATYTSASTSSGGQHRILVYEWGHLHYQVW